MERMIRWVALSLAALSFSVDCAAAGQFGYVKYAKAGVAHPYIVVTARLTGSGNADLVLTDYVGGHVSVLLGKGDGTFQPPLAFPVDAPADLVVGDLDEDGYPDLAVVESPGQSAGVLQVFFGNGDGTFHAGPRYQLGIDPISIAAADFNGDGHLGVAVANSNQLEKRGSVMVFVGNGKGKLAKTGKYVVAGSPWSIAAADLNGDKFPDLAVTQETLGSVAVLLNDGTGKFGKPVTYHAGGGEVVDVKIADLRNNGSQDLIAVNASLSRIAILLNKGDGTFDAARFYTTVLSNQDQGADGVVIADFNLDGRLDLAASNQDGNSALLYGNGKGGFGPPVRIQDQTDGGSVFSIAAGDFNHDGAADLAIPIEDKGKVAILTQHEMRDVSLRLRSSPLGNLTNWCRWLRQKDSPPSPTSRKPPRRQRTYHPRWRTGLRQ
jgi:FG-GAP-like repeat